jgi:flagellin
VSLSILTNTAASQTELNLLHSSNSVATSMQRLSSGLRINTAADDAAGYAISQGMTSQVNGLNVASDNTSEATSMVQTADSALNNIQDMLQRVRELTVQYQNGINGGSGTTQTNDQTAIQDEVNQLTTEISRQVYASNFNGVNLLNGNAGGSGVAGVTFQVGANDADKLTATFANVLGASGLSITGFTWTGGNTVSTGTVFNLASTVNSTTALSNLDAAINNISSLAASLGAVQNRLQYTSDSISATETNLSSSNSQITDVNMASEMTNMTQQQILEQAGTAMLAQAQSQPQLILKLIQG